MKGKIITVLIIINLILVGGIYNLINKDNINNKKLIIKEMTETEYEDYITELNQSHEDYANYIEESKKKIASAITDMGVETSNEETLETMASNIRSLIGVSSKSVIDLILDTNVEEWSLSDKTSTSFLIGTNNILMSFTGNGKQYATYEKSISMKGKSRLLLSGSLEHKTSTASSSTTYWVYGYVEISKDNGNTWDVLNTFAISLGGGQTNKSTDIVAIIDLSKYNDNDCFFRLGLSTNRSLNTGTMNLTMLEIE